MDKRSHNAAPFILFCMISYLREILEIELCRVHLMATARSCMYTSIFIGYLR